MSGEMCMCMPCCKLWGQFSKCKDLGTWNTVDNVTRSDTLEVGLSDK